MEITRVQTYAKTDLPITHLTLQLDFLPKSWNETVIHNHEICILSKSFYYISLPF